MSLLLLSGDPHGKADSRSLSTHEKYLNAMLEAQDRLGVGAVVFLGDQFDSFSVIRSEVMNLWIEYLDKTAKEQIFLKGNHDEAAKFSKWHSLRSLEDKATVVDKPLVRSFGNKECVFLPYYHGVEAFEKGLLSAEARKDGILFCHQSFDGVKFHSGYYDPHGVPLEMVASFVKVVAGHIHKQQGFGNVWYPGAPYAHSFGEANQDHFVWLFDTENLSAKPINLGLPKFIEAKFDGVGNVVEWLSSQRVEDSYKIVISDTKVAISALQDSAAFKAIKKKMRVLVEPKFVDSVCSEARMSEGLTKEGMLAEYVNKHLKTDLDREVLVRVCNSLLEEANG